MDTVHICFITDNAYAMPTSVAITSALMNKDAESIYIIYIICLNVSAENIKKLKSCSTMGVKIQIIEVEEDEGLNRYAIKGISATPTALLKFQIPNVLKDLDKVLFLDGDIIIQCDLASLYHINIDDCLIGAAKDPFCLVPSLYHLYKKRNILYINSGVMLMNLKKMREQGVTDQLIEYRKNGYNELMDQDTFNMVLHNHIFVLPMEYNTALHYPYLQKDFQKIRHYYQLGNNIQNREDVYKNAKILHFTVQKPWKYSNVTEHEIWEYYFSISPYSSNGLEKRLDTVSKEYNKGFIYRILGYIRYITNVICHLPGHIRMYMFMRSLATNEKQG